MVSRLLLLDLMIYYYWVNNFGELAVTMLNTGVCSEKVSPVCLIDLELSKQLDSSG